MAERSRTERFDEVFQIILIIEAIFLEFVWTFVYATILTVIMFVIALILWVWGTLTGGAEEYPLKIGGFQSSLLLLSILLFMCVVTPDIGFWAVLAVGISFLISLFFSLLIVSYLGKLVNRNLSFRILAALTVGECLGFITGLFLIP